MLNKVHPSKLDVDAPRDEGTFNQEIPAAIYDDYYTKLGSAVASFGGPGLVIVVRSFDIDGETVISLGTLFDNIPMHYSDIFGDASKVKKNQLQLFNIFSFQ